MKVTATQLRQNLYRLLDEVIATGVPLEIERGGQTLRIVPVGGRSKLENLVPRSAIVGDPDDLVHLDWSGEWRP